MRRTEAPERTHCPHCSNPIPKYRTENSIVWYTVTCGNSHCQEAEYYACMARSKAKKRKV